MSNRRGKLFVVSSPSGGGKTTLAGKLIGSVPNLVRSVSMTTRPPRQAEVDKTDYFFVTPKKFRDIKQSGGFIESARVFGFHYGTPKLFVERERRRGNDILLLIDVQGGLSVRKKCPDAVLIFIMPPSIKELGVRLRRRSTDSESTIKRRLKMARSEMTQRYLYDYVIKNENLNQAVGELEAIITAERLKV